MDQRAQVPLAFDDDILAIDWHDRDVNAGELVVLEHFRAAQNALPHLVRHAVALARHRHAHREQHVLAGNEVLLRQHHAIRQAQQLHRHFVARPVLGDCDLVGIKIARRVHRVEGRLLRLLPLRFELVIGEPLDDVAYVPVRRVRTLTRRIAVDRQRVGNALDNDVLIEHVMTRVFGGDADVPDPARHRRFDGRVVCNVGIARVLDLSQQTGDDLRSADIARVIHRMDLDRRLVLPRVVDHLSNKRRHAIDRHHRTTFAFALPTDRLGPLLAETREPHILDVRLAVLRLVLNGAVERLACFGDDVLVAHWGVHVAGPADCATHDAAPGVCGVHSSEPAPEYVSVAAFIDTLYDVASAVSLYARANAAVCPPTEYDPAAATSLRPTSNDAALPVTANDPASAVIV